MEITWLGHACFRIRSREATILSDPVPRSAGYQIGRQAADIVTISCRDPNHSSLEAVTGTPKVLDGPGEFEISRVLLTGVRTERRAGGFNTVFVIEAEEMRVCHLGAMDQPPSAAQIELMNEPDVLLIPVGGNGALDGTAAAELATLLEAKLVVPMRYRTEASTVELEPPDRFLKGTARAGQLEPQPRLQISRSQVPGEMKVVLLDYRK